MKVQLRGVMGKMVRAVKFLHTECSVDVSNGLTWNMEPYFILTPIKLDYKSLFLEVYWTTSSDQDFKTEEPKRPNFKYLPPDPKSDSQTCTFLLV